MNKKIQFILISVWILFSRAYDAYCTYQYTPELDKEANPLVSVLGISSWTLLLSIIGILSLYVIYAYYQSSFKSFDAYPKDNNLGFGDFAGFLYTGEKNHWTAVLYKIPNTFKRFNYYFGNIMSRALSFAGVVSTIMWLLLNNSETYKKMHSATMIYAILIIGSIILIYLWFAKEYRVYKDTKR